MIFTKVADGASFGGLRYMHAWYYFSHVQVWCLLQVNKTAFSKTIFSLHIVYKILFQIGNVTKRAAAL